jgi:uncharacterized protein YabN with tetrapyrrole methylase and pyrophosphatase domain
VKSTERGDRQSVFEGVAGAAPALAYAQKLQKRAAGVGFDWIDAQGALDKIAEETAEVAHATTDDAREMELGDVLFSVVNVARHLGIDAEIALRKSANKFRSRFAEVEALAARRGITLANATLDELDALWDEAKSSLNP